MTPRIPLATLGALKSLAESDAKIMLKRLLNQRKAGLALSIDDMTDAKAASVQRFCEQNAIEGAAIFACAKFYAAEFDRAIETLWDLGCAALGIDP